MSVEYGEIKKIDVEGYTRKIFHVSNLVLNSELEGKPGQLVAILFYIL